MPYEECDDCTKDINIKTKGQGYGNNNKDQIK